MATALLRGYRLLKPAIPLDLTRCGFIRTIRARFPTSRTGRCWYWISVCAVVIPVATKRAVSSPEERREVGVVVCFLSWVDLEDVGHRECRRRITPQQHPTDIG